ncbi:ABC transporter [Wenjunlia tyrosinilytica]|uniref:ABC transporter n=1 Tax=Wenjunlia tyrosinilytica TaxID=1544741 RepID=A0A917ZN09_9ACTN|nr:ABC transporter [Wenjunlia tyrosinilytica]GGO87047.1 hypothetical protein GCM10012280_24630 [Wenjunlia tyrosinilytica]
MIRALVVALLAPTWRTLPWAPLAAGGTLGLALVGAPALLPLTLPPVVLVDLVRVAALSGALGAAFLLDDPAGHTTGAVPTPRLLRHSLRTALLLPLAAGWWVAVLAVARLAPASGAGLPYGALTVEAAALTACSVACAAGVLRWGGGTAAGSTAGPAVIVLSASLAAVPHRYRLFVAVDDPHWADVHRYGWAGLLAAAVCGWFAWSLQPTTRRPVSGGFGGRRAFGAAGSR